MPTARFRQDQPSGFNLRRYENKLIAIFIIALLIYITFIFFGDFRKIKAAILHFNWTLIPLLLILTLINYFIRAARFHFYLKQIGIHISFNRTFFIFVSGLSMTVTPGKTGEVIKAYLLKRTQNASITHVIPTLVFERMTDGIAMIFLGLIGLFFVRQSLLFFFFSVLFVIAFILAVKLKRLILHLIKTFEKIFPKLKILQYFEIFFDNTEKLITGKNFLVGIGLGIISWSFEGVSLAILVSQFAHVNLFYNLAISLFIFSFSSIAGFFVFIPGGLGVAEGSITYFLTSLFALSLPTAIFITLLFRFITLWFGVGLGISILLWYIRRVDQTH